VCCIEPAQLCQRLTCRVYCERNGASESGTDTQSSKLQFIPTTTHLNDCDELPFRHLARPAIHSVALCPHFCWSVILTLTLTLTLTGSPERL
jgi:hypothetical protein